MMANFKGCKRISHKKAINLIMKRVRDEEKKVHRWEGRRSVYFRYLESGGGLWVGKGNELRMKTDRSVYLCKSKW
jgi:hypothetical protein